jgi:outer membrane lipoprotein-sorting protein
MKTILFLIAVLPGVNHPLLSEAESLYRDMEGKLRRASTVQCSVEVQFNVGEDSNALRGTLARERGNKMRLEIPLWAVNDDEHFWTTVSDGWTMTSGETGKGGAVAAPRNLDDFLSSVVAGTGLIGFVGGLRDDHLSEEAIRESLSGTVLSKFKIERRESVGDCATVCISYLIGSRKEGQPLRVELWIDPARSLPVKRKVTLESGQAFVETYSDFEINRTIERERFATK